MPSVNDVGSLHVVLRKPRLVPYGNLKTGGPDD